MTKRPDIKAVTQVAKDRMELVSMMEPLRIADRSPLRAEMTDLAVDLAQKSAALRHSLPEGLLVALADLVRAMNCYYSNLIEGHDTHPVDIERALKGDYSSNQAKRSLQKEAQAHIAVQGWIDSGGFDQPAVSACALRELHRRFCELLPEDLLYIEEPRTGERLKVVPGELRQRDVMVGEHIAISAPAVPRFLARYEMVYANLGKTDTIIATAAAHHRLVWIHPFLDGNGRVARLVSHATLLKALDTGALWSIARGLARNMSLYKSHLAACDQPRQGDLDGRGNLSEKSLGVFTAFFLRTCIDQVDFMQGLMQPAQLRPRIMVWAEEEARGGRLPAGSAEILAALLYRGEIPRADIAAIVGKGERQARRITSALIASGVVRTDSAYAPLKLAFPAALAHRWLPGLFPAL